MFSYDQNISGNLKYFKTFFIILQNQNLHHYTGAFENNLKTVYTIFQESRAAI